MIMPQITISDILQPPAELRLRFLEEWDAAVAYSKRLRNGVVLNRTAFLILSLCDGVRTVGEICGWIFENAAPTLLSQETVTSDVFEIMNQMQQWGLLEHME
jgi:hypothetical protein